MSMSLTSKAVSALEQSVALIIGADDIDDATKRSELAETFDQFSEYMERNLGKQRDADDDIEKGVDHHASTVADLLVESGRFPDRAAALDHLLGNQQRQALLSRMKKETPMEPIEIMKRHPLAFCRVVAQDGDAHGVSEHELVAALTKHASELHPGMSADKAFAKLYENQDVWQACAIAKAAPFANTGGAPVVNPDVQVVTGADAQNVNDVTAAMDALHRIGRLQWPELSSEQAFSRAFRTPRMLH
jgi:hypothetical protein